MKKYELSDVVRNFGGKTLYRIRSLVSISQINLKKDDLGGFVESEENLSQNGRCWIFDDALVYNNGKVYDNALIYDNVRVYNNAKCYENCIISGHSLISDFSKCYGESVISENSLVFNNSSVYGNCKLYGIAEVSNKRHFFEGELNNKYITIEELKRIKQWRKQK